jgi:hypothetical protein
VDSCHVTQSPAVDWGKENWALFILIAGTNDHVVPMQVVKAEKEKYSGPSTVELKIFEWRTHGIVNQQGWEEVADFLRSSGLRQEPSFEGRRFDFGDKGTGRSLQSTIILMRRNKRAAVYNSSLSEE